MGRAERFEDLVAWQKARVLTTAIYKAAAEGKFARDFGLRDQIQRAAVSSMSNVAEGYERGRPAEFQHFLSIAKGSCGEVRSELYVALDVGYLPRESFDALFAMANEASRVINGLRASINRTRN